MPGCWDTTPTTRPLGELSGLRQGGHHQLAAGIGSFGFEPNVDSFFGIPRRVQGGGMAMNIPIVNIIGHDDAKHSKDFAIQLGMRSSALEHSVPEQLFGSPQNPKEGISAAKALQKAAAGGQRIYQVTAANQATTLPLIPHESVTMDEIRAAVNAGKTVITHTRAVSVPGWTGAGYVILDTETGAGAWKITGGANGGYLLGLVIGVFLIQALALSAITAPLAAAHGVALFSEIASILAASWLAAPDSPAAACFFSGFLVGVGIGLLAFGALIPSR